MHKTIVTKDDYFLEEGIDLDMELSSVVAIDNPTEIANIFIHGVEKRTISWLRNHRDWNGEFKSEYQIEQFKLGIIEQIKYTIMIGDLNLKNLGQKMKLNELIAIQLSPTAMNFFQSGGMANLKRWG